MKPLSHLVVLSVAAFAPALAAQAPAPAAASPQPPKLTLKWTTASEVDNAGYYVYRGDSAEGPFKLLNETMVPGAGNSETPTKYVFEDTGVEPGRTYYYYLESISIQGQREKFSPVMSRTCCSLPGSAKVEDAPPPAAPPTPPSPAPKP